MSDKRRDAVRRLADELIAVDPVGMRYRASIEGALADAWDAAQADCDCRWCGMAIRERHAAANLAKDWMP